MRHGLSVMTALVIATSILVTAQENKPAEAVETGRGLFLLYCASCHGPEGRGNGPAGDEFRHRPADLTQFANRNGGVFNDALIHRVVDGRAVKSHGTMEMPVWGDAFKRRLGLDEDAITQRIEAIVRYIGAIQERSGH